MHDVWVLGHLTKDLVRTADSPGKFMPGGVAHYAGFAYRRLGLDCAVLTKIASSDAQGWLVPLRDAGIETVLFKSSATTSFENIYSKGLAGSRTQRVTSIAAPFEAQDLAGVGGRCVHLGPLTVGDMPLAVFEMAGRNFDCVVLDLQGCLRAVVESEVVRTEWDEGRTALGFVDILKASEAEAALMSGRDDPIAAAESLSALGPREVVITLGAAGSVVFADGAPKRISSVPARAAVDPTGCGDTYLAAYVTLRLEEVAPADAAAFASAAASLKLEIAGALQADRDEIFAQLDEVGERGRG